MAEQKEITWETIQEKMVMFYYGVTQVGIASYENEIWTFQNPIIKGSENIYGKTLQELKENLLYLIHD